MVHRNYFFIALLYLIPGLSGFWGCVGTSPPTDYYLLSALQGRDVEKINPETGQCPAIGVGPVKLSAYLDRQQIVTRSGSNVVELSEFHRWAEPLKINVGRVLRDNLSMLLNTEHILLFPWTKAAKVEYKVVADILRFDAGPDNKARLEVRWSIIRVIDSEILLAKKSSLNAHTGSTEYAAIVAAQSQTLADFSREVAASITDIYQSAHGR